MASDNFLDSIRLVRPSYATCKDPSDGPPVLAFPEVGSEWDGFCLAHLHLVGVNVSIISNDRMRKRIILHEMTHRSLQGSPLNKIFTLGVIEMWFEISLLSKGKESVEEPTHRHIRPIINPVRLPLVSSTSESFLQACWAKLVALNDLIAPIEEVCAIWSSLRAAQEEGLISQSEKRTLIRIYKLNYGRRLFGFSELYDQFSDVASNMRAEEAQIFGFLALATENPYESFREILQESKHLIELGLDLNDIDLIGTHFIYSQFLKRFGEINVLDIDNEIECIFSQIDSDFIEYLFDDHSRLFLFPFDRTGFDFSLSLGSDVGGSFMFHSIFLESIRQQLTQGRGLICPFWRGGRCCEMRSTLEGIWRHTTHDLSWEHWQRQGCLNEPVP